MFSFFDLIANLAVIRTVIKIRNIRTRRHNDVNQLTGLYTGCIKK